MPATGGDTLYGPIKSFLIKASQGLWLETQGTGVHVTALCPGYTYTEFHDVNGSRAQVSSAYPKWMWMERRPRGPHRLGRGRGQSPRASRQASPTTCWPPWGVCCPTPWR